MPKKSALNLQPKTLDIFSKINYFYDSKANMERINTKIVLDPQIKTNLCTLINNRTHAKLSDKGAKFVFDYIVYIRERYDGLLERDSKAFNNDFDSFVNWWFDNKNYNKNNGAKCCYCGSTQKQWKKILDDPNSRFHKSKKGGSKNVWGKPNMEVERIIAGGPYDKNNCSFACHLCNNAKSDMIENEDFKPIGKVIGKYLKSL